MISKARKVLVFVAFEKQAQGHTSIGYGLRVGRADRYAHQTRPKRIEIVKGRYKPKNRGQPTYVPRCPPSRIVGPCVAVPPSRHAIHATGCCTECYISVQFVRKSCRQRRIGRSGPTNPQTSPQLCGNSPPVECARGTVLEVISP
jgi:hypothetical protein